MAKNRTLPKELFKNSIVDLKIDAISSEGVGIGRFDGVAVFVPNTALGDEISCKIVKTQKNLCYGIVEKIKTPSEMRVEIDCPYFVKCGGCSYRHIDYKSEAKIKNNKVIENVQRIGEYENIEAEEIICAKNRDKYRNKAQIPIGLDKDGKLIMGFYARHSHRIIDMKSCLLQKEEMDIAVDIFRQWFEEFGDSVYSETTHKGVLRHLYLRYAEKTDELMICVVINGKTLKNADKLVAMLRDNLPCLVSVMLNINKEKTNVVLGKEYRLLFGKEYVSDILCGLKFDISAPAFYQVNRTQAEKLYEKAMEYAELTGGETLIDLYCGTGTIGLSMAKKVKKLIGVEIIPQAIENAKKNATRNEIENAEFICADASQAAKVLEERGVKPDVVILDPPRKGCDEELIHTVSKMQPKKIVYISCDSATLARDLKRFKEFSYTLKKISPCDLFPGTFHVEAVCLVEREEK